MLLQLYCVLFYFFIDFMQYSHAMWHAFLHFLWRLHLLLGMDKIEAFWKKMTPPTKIFGVQSMSLYH